MFYFFRLLCEWRLQGMGFERGWGDTAERVLEMMHLLLDLLEAPDPSTLETFLGRVPMVFNVVTLSPHGYFGQANVLGLPDTGGQVFLFIHICHQNIRARHVNFVYCPSLSLLISCNFDLLYLTLVWISFIYEHHPKWKIFIGRLFIYWIQKQGLDFSPRILIVTYWISLFNFD